MRRKHPALIALADIRKQGFPLLSDELFEVALTLLRLWQRGYRIKPWQEMVMVQRTGGSLHCVDAEGHCGCQAGDYGNRCWAAKLVAELGYANIIEAAGLWPGYRS